MAKIEINASDEELKKIAIFLKNNNIKHIIHDESLDLVIKGDLEYLSKTVLTKV